MSRIVLERLIKRKALNALRDLVKLFTAALPVDSDVPILTMRVRRTKKSRRFHIDNRYALGVKAKPSAMIFMMNSMMNMKPSETSVKLNQVKRICWFSM